MNMQTHRCHRFPTNGEGANVIRILSDEKGVTLLEILVTSIVIVATILSIYIGVVYAEKQVLNNYRDRVATLLASGELEWQYFHYHNYNHTFSTFNNRPVIIDQLPKGKKLMGSMSVQVTPLAELYAAQSVPYNNVKVSVSWVDPGTKKPRTVVLIEDFYR